MHRAVHQLTIALIATACLLTGAACDRSQPATQKPGRTLATKDASDVIPLSDCDGEIQHIVLHVPAGLAGRVAKPACDLLTGLSPHTRVSFLCEDDAASAALKARLKTAGLQDRPKIEFIKVAGPLSVWARDRYVAVRPAQSDGRPIWMIPRLPPYMQEERRKNEQALPSSLQSSLGITTWKIPLVLEGGNLVATDTHVFIGANVKLDNAYARLPAETSKELSHIFGLPVILVGNDKGSVPFPHVDMYMTPVARDHLLVASPELGHKILGEADDESRQAANARLFGDPDPSSTRTAQFDQVASQLEQHGFTITRLPYIDNRGGDFVVTYNNVLQENRDGQHIVYLPTYEIPALDTAARQAYESLGFTVHSVDVSPISHLLGAIRCMVNVVDRGPNPTPSDANTPNHAK